jgi:8-oxo-dGTP diphosphatase
MEQTPPIQVVCGIVIHANHVLATRRDARGRYPRYWEFPGGKLERDESPEIALHRELEEELELKIKNLVPLESVSFSEGDFAIKLIPFACVADQDNGPAPRDHGEIRWISPDDALRLTWAPADIPLVEQLPEIIAQYEHE